MKLLLIRHAQSIGNAEGRLQGQFDSPLSDEGRAQARALARRLRREERQVTALYASDLSRAAETAEILGKALGLPVTLDPRLREYDAGVLNGLTWPQIEVRYPELWRELQHSGEWVPIPGEEGNETFHTRVAALLSDVQAAHDGDETAALVSHGGTLNMLLLHLLGMERERGGPFSFGNTSLSLVEFRPRGPVIRLLNDTCHLLP